MKRGKPVLDWHFVSLSTYRDLSLYVFFVSYGAFLAAVSYFLLEEVNQNKKGSNKSETS